MALPMKSIGGEAVKRHIYNINVVAEEKYTLWTDTNVTLLGNIGCHSLSLTHILWHNGSRDRDIVCDRCVPDGIVPCRVCLIQCWTIAWILTHSPNQWRRHNGRDRGRERQVHIAVKDKNNGWQGLNVRRRRGCQCVSSSAHQHFFDSITCHFIKAVAKNPSVPGTPCVPNLFADTLGRVHGL